jgi:hypothetical protein
MTQIKSNNVVFREDQIERVYTLGDSENIVKNIIKNIINKSLLESRKKYLLSLKKNYVMNKTFNYFDALIDLKMIYNPYLLNSNEVSEPVITEVNRSKLDSWASKRIKPFYEELVEEQADMKLPSIKIFKEVENKAKKKNKPIEQQVKNGGRKSTNPIIQIIQTSSSNNEKIPSSEGNTDKTTSLNEKNKKEDSGEFVTLIEDYRQEKIDDHEQARLRALRTYINEKEQDGIRKKKMLRELEEKQIEEEKLKKKINDNVKIHSYDANGKFIFLKPIDPDKLVPMNKASYSFKSKKLTKQINKDKKSQDSSLNNQVALENTNSKVFTVPNEPKEIFTPPEIYYQPDPLESVELSDGVNMICNGKTKPGKTYNMENKMNEKEFLNILNQINPKRFKVIDLSKEMKVTNEDENKIIKETIVEIKEENLETNKKISNVFGEDDINKHLDKTKLKFDSISHNSILNLKAYPLKTTNKFVKNSVKSKPDYVKKSHDFNYFRIEKFDDQEVYNQLGIINTVNVSTQKIIQNSKLPANRHGEITQELGFMKKYPRERVSKDILAISGKISKKEHTKNKSEDFKGYTKRKLNTDAY